MRKISSVMLCAILMFVFSVPAQAANVEINYPSIGTVIKIIDGDAIWVSLQGQAQNTAYVRFIGADCNGNRDSLDFLTSYLLGKQVVIVPEVNGKVQRMSGRYNLAYVFITDKNSLDTAGLEMINDTVLLKGHAKLNEDHKDSRYYKQFQEAQAMANSRLIGVWTAPEGLLASTVTPINSNNAINVNTAAEELLQLVFTGVSNSVIDNIIRYREANPFNNVSELKFVNGVTKEMYDRFARELSVTTNINAATERELLSLDIITQSEVAAIIKSRSATAFTDQAELSNRLLINRGLYETIKHFITVQDAYALAYTPGTVVNINTATVAQLKKTGLSASLSQAVVDGRADGAYSYKTLMELMQLNAFSSSATINLHYYEDNLVVYTDINNAGEREMASLFSESFSTKTLDNIMAARPFSNTAALINYISEKEYNRIKDFIYVDSMPDYTYVNIAAATKEQLRSVGFTAQEVERIQKVTIKTAADIPVDTKGLANQISIYTNINTATGEELLTLSPKMTGSVVNAIVAYRNEQPFGSLSEVRSFFEDRGISGVYTDIRSYLVVR